MIAGKPLIAWSIKHALEAKHVDEVYVSTNSEKIARISTEYGANVPFLRPDNISKDTSTTESAIEHFCKYLDEHQRYYDNFNSA